MTIAILISVFSLIIVFLLYKLWNQNKMSESLCDKALELAGCFEKLIAQNQELTKINSKLHEDNLFKNDTIQDQIKLIEELTSELRHLKTYE